MGLKDHLEDETGHILNLALDLDYLHVEGTDRQASLSATVGTHSGALERDETEVGGTHSSVSSSSSSSSCSNSSEESAASDSEDERGVQHGSGSDAQTTHPHPCHPAGQGPAQSPHSRDPKHSTNPFTEYRSKMEFALKLGYSEELVLLVVQKLGPDALINDILGELVKLGTKSETDQAGGSATSHSPSSSLSSSSLDSCRLDCSSQLLLDDKENIRPVVVDGSNVAMR